MVLGYDTLQVSAPQALLALLGPASPAPAGCPDGRSLGDSLRAALVTRAAKTWANQGLRWAEPI